MACRPRGRRLAEGRQELQPRARRDRHRCRDRARPDLRRSASISWPRCSRRATRRPCWRPSCATTRTTSTTAASCSCARIGVGADQHDRQARGGWRRRQLTKPGAALTLPEIGTDWPARRPLQIHAARPVCGVVRDAGDVARIASCNPSANPPSPQIRRQSKKLHDLMPRSPTTTRAVIVSAPSSFGRSNPVRRVARPDDPLWGGKPATHACQLPRAVLR